MKSTLEKSHSGLSNFKLSLILILASLSFFILFLGLGLFNILREAAYILAGIGFIGSIISFILIKNFIR